MELIPGFDPGTLQWDITWWTVVSWAGKLLGIAFIPSVMLQRGTRPMTAVAWILCLLTLPFVGVILWWGIGRNYMERRRRKRSRSQARISHSFNLLEREMPRGPWAHLKRAPDRYHAARAQALVLHDEHGIFPSTRNNRVVVYDNASAAYDAIEEAVRAARHHIHFEFYIWQRDETGRRFRDLLVQKAREGVEVRVLYDGVGSAKIQGRFVNEIVHAGGKAAPFLPVRLFERRLSVNFRNHRKIIVIDGRVAFAGGINIGDEYREWFDTAYRFEGPIVYQLQEVFAEDWYFATYEDLAEHRYFHDRVGLAPGGDDRALVAPTSDGATQGGATQGGEEVHEVVGRVVASGPDDTLDTIQKMFFMAITGARERVYLVTPYFVPDHAIITALQTAAMRGLDVRILVPARSDVPITQHAGRSYFESLLECGVRIYEYNRSVLHAKLLIVDENLAFVGSANMDIRSFRFNFENNVVLDGASINRRLTRLFFESLEDSTEIDLEPFRRRPRRDRLIEAAARLLSPLL